jgi:hypothetical protein
MGNEIPEALAVASHYQSGMVSRQQAVRAGLTRSGVTAKVAAGRWQRVHWGVYAMFTGPLNREAQLWAAVLYGGPGAMLSHETAGELHRLVDRSGATIHLTVPHDRIVRAAPGITIHRSRYARDLRFPLGELPRTLVPETILDLAEASKDLDDVCGWVCTAFSRNLISVEVMRCTLAARKRQRWRTEIEELSTAAAGGAHSVLEFRYDRDVERAHGLPPSRQQVRFKKRDGRTGFRDRVYEEYAVIVELDGKQAHPDEQRWQDKRRDNDAAAGGEQSLRYGWREVRWESCDTAGQVAQVLRRRGWTGSPRACSPGCVAVAISEFSGD